MENNNNTNSDQGTQAVSTGSPTTPFSPIETFKSKAGAFAKSLKPKSRIISTMLGILVLTGALGAGTYLVQQRQNTKTEAGSVILSLDTSNKTPKVGDTFTTTVAINTNGASVTAADLRIWYTKEKLKPLKIEKIGDFLPTELVPGTIDTAYPRALIQLGCIIDGTGAHPKSGAGILAKVTFQAIASGPASVWFGNSIVTAGGQGTNALGTTNSVAVTVVGLGTPTPTGTPTSSPTPGSTASPTPSTAVPTITNGGIVQSYTPWAVWLWGTNLSSTLKARLIDTNGAQWGGDIQINAPVVKDATTQTSSFRLPSNSPPSGCNVGKTCTVGLYLVNSAGALSNKYNLTLPAK